MKFYLPVSTFRISQVPLRRSNLRKFFIGGQWPLRTVKGVIEVLRQYEALPLWHDGIGMECLLGGAAADQTNSAVGTGAAKKTETETTNANDSNKPQQEKQAFRQLRQLKQLLQLAVGWEHCPFLKPVV